MAEPLVLDDRCVADTLVLAEDTVGKQHALPTHLKGPVEEVVELDVLAGKLLGDSASFQDDLLAVVVEAELGADVALFAMA